MLQWERGRRLKSYDIVTYEYDAAGIRQGKQTRTTTHTYYTEGTRIHRETRAHYANNYNLWYYYDQTGICAFECNGTMYHMKKNVQGDIVMLLDVDGNVAAKYVYDAWGNHKVLNPSNAEIRNDTFIGNINPFRYRGYYYDADTKLYYLNSRYYDPEIGRFINADSIDFAEPESISGLNLYAYCGNNPVMFTDSTGHSWWDDLCNGWNNFWNGVGDYFANFGQKVSDIATTTWNSTVDFFSNPAVQKTLMIVGSGLQIAGGIALIATGFGGSLGLTLIGMGSSSIISGLLNEQAGGSFFAGWASGQVSGLLTGIMPFYGGAVGAFVGSIMTDGIDKGWSGIDWGKAAWSGVVGAIFDIVPGAVRIHLGNNAINTIPLKFLFSYRGALTGTINGLFNIYYGR